MGGKKEPRDLIFCHCEALVPFRTQQYGPHTLVSIQRGATSAPHNLPASSANTTAVGASSTTAAALAAIRPDDVSVAASDADICHIVVLTNGFILSAKSAGMDEFHFRSHFDVNRQVRCASGKKCGNPHPVEESSHRCGGCGLLFHSQLTCGSKKLSELAGDGGGSLAAAAAQL